MGVRSQPAAVIREALHGGALLGVVSSRPLPSGEQVQAVGCVCVCVWWG